MDISFNRHKLIYFWVIISLASLFSVISGPLYEVYVDISVSPPENVRKTDFSWITVNEWFMTQSCVITSYDILKEVISHKISPERLKRVISAQRLGAADIVRISARAKENPFELREAISQIAEIYLRRLNKTEEAIKLPEEPREELQEELREKSIRSIHIYREELGLLSADRQDLEGEINILKGRLETNEATLRGITDNQTKIKDLQSRIARIDGQLPAMKQRLTSLRAIYTDVWPEVAKLNQEIGALEQEKGNYNRELTVELNIAGDNEKKKNKLNISILNDKGAMDIRKQELSEIDGRINKITALITQEKEEGGAKGERALKVTPKTPEKKEAQGYILNPPVINFLPELWGRWAFGFLSGFLIWYIAYLILKNKHSSLPRSA